MVKHTPGPWELDDSGNDYPLPVVQSPLIGRIAILCEHDVGVREWEQDKANACLIAAAPDLLAALTIAVRWLRRLEGEYPNCLNDDAIAKHVLPAIRKATGEDA